MKKRIRSIKPLKKDPTKTNLDERNNKGSVDLVCKTCSYINHSDYQNCYNCLNPLHTHKVNFSVFYKTGKVALPRKQYQSMVEETTGKNAKDYLQPMRYNNVTRKMEKNPEFIKHYGDPFKKKKTKKQNS